ncbi:stage III sporulation AE [Babesia caballi]|uniref:Stage III sporulation AE n=1 Tax=Babesia caballi TaxID=5871 RepID=A0AAV4LXT4_BABCB|nr:stage III sporulation AE [Babesia caballi]
MSVTVDFNRNDPVRARHRLIAEYNRKPSIYVEEDISKTFRSIPGAIVSYFSGLFQQPSDLQCRCCDPKLPMRGADKLTEASKEPQPARKHVSGVPRSVFCDTIDVSVYQVLQRALCYAGAGLGIVGVGMVTVFGLFTAATAACAVTACNKVAVKNCDVDAYELESSDAYYEEKRILDTPNNYQPVVHAGFAPVSSASVFKFFVDRDLHQLTLGDGDEALASLPTVDQKDEHAAAGNESAALEQIHVPRLNGVEVLLALPQPQRAQHRLRVRQRVYASDCVEAECVNSLHRIQLLMLPHLHFASSLHELVPAPPALGAARDVVLTGLTQTPRRAYLQHDPQNVVDGNDAHVLVYGVARSLRINKYLPDDDRVDGVALKKGENVADAVLRVHGVYGLADAVAQVHHPVALGRVKQQEVLDAEEPRDALVRPPRDDGDGREPRLGDVVHHLLRHSGPVLYVHHRLDRRHDALGHDRGHLQAPLQDLGLVDGEDVTLFELQVHQRLELLAAVHGLVRGAQHVVEQQRERFAEREEEAHQDAEGRGEEPTQPQRVLHEHRLRRNLPQQGGDERRDDESPCPAADDGVGGVAYMSRRSPRSRTMSALTMELLTMSVDNSRFESLLSGRIRRAKRRFTWSWCDAGSTYVRSCNCSRSNDI